MRLFPLLLLPILTFQAAELPGGRWEGQLQIPGIPVPIVVDLARDSAGQWQGSVILPGLGIKGSPLSEILVKPQEVSFSAKDVFGGATFQCEITKDNRLTGTYRQGGNTAPFALQRAGPAQVDEAPHSTPVQKDLEGIWVGEMMLFGSPKKVRLTLTNTAAGPATAEIFVKGQRETLLKADLITDAEGYLTVIVSAAFISYEGHFSPQSGQIAGTFVNGPYEAPLNLRRNQ